MDYQAETQAAPRPNDAQRRRLYRLWNHILNACKNARHPDYPVLGGMGVKVCTDWRQDFPGFCEWSLTHGYADDRWLVRIRLDEPYGPNNCAWAATRTYRRYLNSSRGHAAFGEVKRIDQWMADSRCVVTLETLRRRLRTGWSVERALTQPFPRPPACPFTKTTIPLGAVFGRLTVVDGVERVITPRGVTSNYYYPCRCSCGREHRASAGSLLRGQTRSCGCLRRELARIRMTVHAETRVNQPRSRLYKIWLNIKNICLSPGDERYQNYGRRGITLCSAWIENFIEFRDWANSQGYTDRHYLQRYDVKGDYTPANCYWSLERRKKVEKRNSRLVTAYGETKCQAEWVRDPRCRVSLHILQSRLEKGWPAERALAQATRPRPNSRMLTAFGETKTLREWSDDPRCVVNYKTLSQRVDNHWAGPDALTIPVGFAGAHPVTAFGETKRLSAWVRDARCLVPFQALAARLADGWDAEKAMTTPSKGKIPPHLITAFGETKSMAEWSRDPRCQVPYHAIKKRLRRGWSPETTLTTPPGAARKADATP